MKNFKVALFAVLSLVLVVSMAEAGRWNKRGNCGSKCNVEKSCKMSCPKACAPRSESAAVCTPEAERMTCTHTYCVPGEYKVIKQVVAKKPGMASYQTEECIGYTFCGEECGPITYVGSLCDTGFGDQTFSSTVHSSADAEMVNQ